MSSFISAFDEAPKTPTRSYTTSKQKVVVESPENTPPSSPVVKKGKKNIATRVPLSSINATQSFDKTLQEIAISDRKGESQQDSGMGGLQSASTLSVATDTQSLAEEPFELGDAASQMSNWRFEQMELEVASLRDELKSLQSNKSLEISEEGSEPRPLLSEPEMEKGNANRFEETISLLQSRIDQLEASQAKVVEVVESNSALKLQPAEVDLMKSISERRMETLVSSFLPFLSETKTMQIAKWMNESMGFSARNTMRRIWSLILLIDLGCIFIQTRFPHLWRHLAFKQIPRGWYKRLSAMRYCLEMLLIMQFGIAAQQMATHHSTISFVKSTASSIYEAIRSLFVKYLPTGLVIACTASFATWLYRNRLAQNMLN
jgi:hypothetical protein